MPYLNLDAALPQDPRILNIGDRAFRLYIAAASYSAQWQLDRIRMSHARMFAGQKCRQYPYSLGGTDRIDNLQTLCRPCNSRKGARI